MSVEPAGRKVDLSALSGAMWRLSALSRTVEQGIPTGFDRLSRVIPGQGWPSGALTEILGDTLGVGELRLLMPALARLSTQGKWVAWIAPPYLPYAPALRNHGLDLSRVVLIRSRGTDQSLWAAEQILRTRGTGAALLWLSRAIDSRRLRRLQLAAETGGSAGFLFGGAERRSQASPAALRLALQPVPEGLEVEVLKCRGAGAGRRVVLTCLRKHGGSGVGATCEPDV